MPDTRGRYGQTPWGAQDTGGRTPLQGVTAASSGTHTRWWEEQASSLALSRAPVLRGAEATGGEPQRYRRGLRDEPIRQLRLYKILFHFKALLWESIILVLPPPTCKAYPTSILLHD